LPSFDEKTISICARGMTMPGLQGDLQDTCGVDASPAAVSRIAGRVIAAVKQWQARPGRA
jgi:putative transposase